MIRQDTYLFVKQKLDSYQLPTTFSLEDMELLLKIIQRLDKEVQKNRESHLLSLKSETKDQKKGENQQLRFLQAGKKFVNRALESQLSKILRENNELHLELICTREELQATRYSLDKLIVEKSQPKKQIEQILLMKAEKEKELFQELQTIKFKNNQLLDMIHEEDNLEKKYIKRLINHQKHDLKPLQEIQGNFLENKEKKFKQHIEDNTDQNPQKRQKRINHSTEQKANKKKQIPQTWIICELKQKLKNRQKQIQRLHKKVQFEGLNMDKVLKDFEQGMAKQKIKDIKNRLQFLQEENINMKKQLDRARKTGGRYQALREEVEKCHKIIKQLKKKKKNCEKIVKQNDFNLKKEKSKLIRQTNKLQEKEMQMELSKRSDHLKIEDLSKRLHFYQKQYLRQGIISQNRQQQNQEIQQQNQDRQLQKQDVKNGQKNNKKQIIKIQQQSSHQNAFKSQIVQEPEDDEQELDSLDQKEGNLKVGQYRQKMKEMTKDLLLKNEQINLKNQAIENLEKMIGTLLKEKQKTVNSGNYNSTQITRRFGQSQISCGQGQIRKYQQVYEEKEAFRGEVKLLQKQIMNLQENLSVKEKQNHQQRKDIQMILIEVKKKEEKLNQIQKITIKLRIELQKSQEQKQSLESLLNESEFQKQELRRQVIQVSNLYKKEQHQNKRKLNEQQLLIKQLEEKLSFKSSKLTNLTQSHQKTHDKLINLNKENRQLKEQIDRITEENHKVQIEKNILKIRVQEYQEQTETHKINYEKVMQLSELEKNQTITLRKKINQLQQDTVNLQQNLHQVNQTNLKLKQQNKTLISQLQKIKIASLEGKSLQDCQNQLVRLHEQYQKVKQRLKTFKVKNYHSNQSNNNTNSSAQIE